MSMRLGLHNIEGTVLIVRSRCASMRSSRPVMVQLTKPWTSSWAPAILDVATRTSSISQTIQIRLDSIEKWAG